MLLGPVFRAELVRTARRRRYYVLRVLYGSALLFLVWVSYLGLARTAALRGGRPLISDTARFALDTFVAFALMQGVTIVAMIPALFGGTIADEKQRKTLHYLMASQLSSIEIVFDKLLARLLHVGVFILLGLPIMSLLTLFGGVAWEYVVVAYAITCSVILFTATMSTLISTLSRRVRQAVLIAYLLIVGWLILPVILDQFLLFAYPVAYTWVHPWIQFVMATTPVYLAWLASGGGGMPFVRGGPAALLDPLVSMVGLQLALSLLFLILAIWQLRPTFRRQETESRRLTWFRGDRRRPTWLKRPACGADAMIWKERYFTRTDILTKMVVLPATILLTVGVVLFGQFDEVVVRSAIDVWQSGFGSGSFGQEQLNHRLRAITPIYLGLWLLAVAGASASSLTVEREEDSWISLVSTPLSGWQIVRGKVIGAIWGLRGFGGLISLIWIFGVALGAVHPLGLFLSCIVVAMLTISVAALGVHESLKARSTSRAMARTLVILIVLNGGYLVVLRPVLVAFQSSIRPDDCLIGCTPILASIALLSYGDLAQLRGSGQAAGFSPIGWFLIMGAWFVLSAYGLAGLALLRRSVVRFDVVIDRPRRDEGPARLEAPRFVNRPLVVGASDRPVHRA